MKSVLEIVHEAINKGELEYLLKGGKSYGLPRPYMCPTDIPTDWDRILKEGIYELYMIDCSLINERVLEKALQNLLTDLEGIYSALNIFFRQLMNEKHGSSPFVMNKDMVVKCLSINLQKNRNDFTKDKRWMGSIEEDGLWSEISRICKIVEDDYGISIIK